MKIEEKDDRLVITDFDELEAYKIACKIEKDGIEFYKSLSENTKDKSIEEKLRFLLGEEEKHLKFFSQCLDELRQKKGDGFEEDDLLNYMDYGVFQPFANAKEKVIEKLDDVKKAIHLGILIEDGSIKFYEACKDKAHPEVKGELENIIEEENKHRSLLEKIMKDL